MGCGKSHIARRLAELLNRECVDTDDRIEKRHGTSISEIFHDQGEEAFRNMETEELKMLLDEPDGRIISLGGGMPCREDNRKILKKLGTTVYLKASPGLLKKRLEGETAGRPMLAGDDVSRRVDELLAAREEQYEAAADIIVSLDGTELEEACERIRKAAEL